MDADFVLPIVAARPLAAANDATGIFPTFADSSSRHRHRLILPSSEATEEGAFGDAEEPAWLLGVQLMVTVLASDTITIGNTSIIVCSRAIT